MDLSDAGQNAVARLAAALNRPAGATWPGEVIDDVLAILVMSSAPLNELDPIEEAILAAFSARIGLESKADGAQLGAKIGAYFLAHPLPPTLATEVTSALRELLTGGNAEKAVAALGAAAGKDAKVPVGQRAGAEGSTRMGVMGRFGLSVPPKK